jgi:hypothetical protein
VCATGPRATGPCVRLVRARGHRVTPCVVFKVTFAPCDKKRPRPRATRRAGDARATRDGDARRRRAR